MVDAEEEDKVFSIATALSLSKPNFIINSELSMRVKKQKYGRKRKK